MIAIRRGTSEDVSPSLEVWRNAVDATHQFLSPDDRTDIDAMVASWLPTAETWLALDPDGNQAGFMVLDGDLIDALFIDASQHGKGYGTALVNHALSLTDDVYVDASEQAANALPFYLSRGFVPTARSETDSEGRPYPLIHLKYAGKRPEKRKIRTEEPVPQQ